VYLCRTKLKGTYQTDQTDKNNYVRNILVPIHFIAESNVKTNEEIIIMFPLLKNRHTINSVLYLEDSFYHY